jgi:hypothetical protein
VSAHATIALLVISTAPLPALAAAFEVPSAEKIFQRVFATDEHVSGVISADAVVEFRVKKSLSDPPDCVLNGITRLEKGHQTVTIKPGAAGTLCWVAKYALGSGFDVREALEDTLPLLDLTVLALKLVGRNHYYLIEGRARDPKTQLRSLIVWVDYERGLLTEGTLVYPWGSIEVEQEYASLNGGWVVTRQYIYTSRFNASLEISYRNFHIANPK